MFYRYGILTLAISVLLMWFVSVAYAGVDKNADDSAAVDSVGKMFPEKKSARRKWEYVMSAPVWIATSPLYISYMGFSKSVELMDRYAIPGKMERILVSEDGTRHIEPYYSSTTGPGIGIWKRGLFADSTQLNVSGSYGLLHRHGIQTELRSIALSVPDLFLDAHLAYHYVPDEPFFGIGPENKGSDEMNYSYREGISFCSLRYRLLKSLNAYVAGTVDYYDIKKGKREEVPSVEQLFSGSLQPTGFNSSSVMGGGMVGIDLDTRDNSGRTRKGFLIKTHAALCREINVESIQDEDRTTRFGFYRSSFDVAHFISMPWGPGRVLVLRAALQQLYTMKNKEVPVYQLGTLGGDETIRGFSRGRFRDRDVALVSSEYRYPIWWEYPFCLDAALFFDAGQVSRDIMSEFRRDNIHYGYGGGLRLYNHDELTAAVYFGFSKDDFRMELALGEDSLTRLLNAIKKMADI